MNVVSGQLSSLSTHYEDVKIYPSQIQAHFQGNFHVF